MNTDSKRLNEHAYLWDSSNPDWILVDMRVEYPSLPEPGYAIYNLNSRQTIRICDDALYLAVVQAMLSSGKRVLPPSVLRAGDTSGQSRRDGLQ